MKVNILKKEILSSFLLLQSAVSKMKSGFRQTDEKTFIDVYKCYVRLSCLRNYNQQPIIHQYYPTKHLVKLFLLEKLSEYSEEVFKMVYKDEEPDYQKEIDLFRALENCLNGCVDVSSRHIFAEIRHEINAEITALWVLSKEDTPLING
jgi:hypothetical protein